MNIDFSKVIEWQVYLRLNPMLPDAVDAIEMRRSARSYIESFRWCESIRRDYVGMLFPGIVSVFLLNVKPARPGVDDWMWVVVGDIPPAYIACAIARNPAEALDAYIGAMQEWVATVRAGGDVRHLIPVNVLPSTEAANNLERRLNFLDSEVLSKLQDDL